MKSIYTNLPSTNAVSILVKAPALFQNYAYLMRRLTLSSFSSIYNSWVPQPKMIMEIKISKSFTEILEKHVTLNAFIYLFYLMSHSHQFFY
jgi:hypothetical protein